MAGGLIEVIVDADPSSVLAAVRGIESAISDASLESWLEVDANTYVTQRAAARFVTEGDDVVGQWAQLSPATVEIRQSKGYQGAHPINKRTGELEAFIIHSRGQIAPTGDGVMLTTPDSATGELAFKLAVAQSGGTSKWGNPVPKRPVIGLNMDDGLVLTKMLEAHIESRLVDEFAL